MGLDREEGRIQAAMIYWLSTKAEFLINHDFIYLSIQKLSLELHSIPDTIPVFKDKVTKLYNTNAQKKLNLPYRGDRQYTNKQ